MVSTKGALFSLAAVASAANYQLGLTALPSAASSILTLLGHVQIFRLLSKGRTLRAAWLAAWLVRFPLGGGDFVPLVSHIARALLWGRSSVGLRLPPAVPWSLFFETVKKNGIWRRHHTEQVFRKAVGPIYRIYQPFSNSKKSALGTMIVWVSDPTAVEQVLGDRDSFPSRGPTGFSEFTKNGLLGLPTGDMHAKHRRVVSAFLSTSYLTKFSGDLADEIRVLFGKWDRVAESNAAAVNLHYELSMLTLDMIMRVGLGSSERRQLIAEEDNVQNGQLDYMLREIVLRTALPFHRLTPSWFPGARARQERVAAIMKFGQEQSEVIQQTVHAAMKSQSRENSDAGFQKTMLSSMMMDGSMTEEEVSDELKTIKGAGHETTSNTLCWALLLLMKNPDKLNLLRAEVDSTVSGDIPTFTECKRLQYASMVVYETLRLYPTVPTFPRLAAKATKVGGFDIPAGSMVFVSQSGLNRDPSIWPNPEGFEPERFGPKPPDLMPSKPVGVPNSGPRFGFVPFGAGVRTCIGQRLAMMEAVQILGALVKRYEFSLDLPAGVTEVQEFADVTLGPKKGMPLKIVRRQQKTS